MDTRPYHVHTGMDVQNMQIGKPKLGMDTRPYHVHTGMDVQNMQIGKSDPIMSCDLGQLLCANLWCQGEALLRVARAKLHHDIGKVGSTQF